MYVSSQAVRDQACREDMKACVSFQAEGTTLKEKWVRLSEVCVHYIVALV